MDRKKLLKHLVILMFFIFILNYLGEKFYWPYSIWYFDMITHTLGGLWVGLFFAYFYSFSLPVSKNLATNMVLIVTSLLIMGLLWECFEYYAYTIVGGANFVPLDTASDVCFDLVGGLLAVTYFMRSNYDRQTQ
jgi:hypothetical protein